MALPSPAAVWRLTSAGRRVACAKPSAIATTDASWSPRTYRKSAARLSRKGCSVEPTLPKMVVIRYSRRRSNVASRTGAVRWSTMVVMGAPSVLPRDAGGLSTPPQRRPGANSRPGSRDRRPRSGATTARIRPPRRLWLVVAGVAQEGEHGEHAAVLAGARAQAELVE